MYDRIRGLLAPPVVKDENQVLSATLLNTVLLAMLGVTLVVPPLLLLANPIEEEGDPSLLLGWVMAALMAGLWYIMRRGYIEEVSYLFSFVFLLLLTAVTFLFGGIRNAGTVGFVLVIILAILLLRTRFASMLFTGLTILVLMIAYYAELQGMLKPQPPGVVSAVDFIIYCSIFALTGSLLHFAVRNLNDAIERARASEREAEKANQQLQGLNADLENRVAARTQALVTSAEISRDVSTILDKEQLVKDVADKIRNAFNYYQVHLYLLNEAGDLLELAAGAGHAGAELAARKHTVAIDEGLVGRAARTNEPVIAPDVKQVELWLANPLLPDTKSEVTVPISLAGKVLGVLDIQQNIRNSLGQSEANLLLSISGQVAVALQNANLLAQARQQADYEGRLNEVNQQIQSATTMEQAMQIAVREVGRALNVPQTRVRLGRRPEAASPLPPNGHTAPENIPQVNGIQERGAQESGTQERGTQERGTQERAA
jgi:putative methionine-R-sulfoxide reductase with GAF domain